MSSHASRRLKKPHSTLTVGGDKPLPGGFAKGVWKARPDTPLTTCGSALARNAPPKKYAGKCTSAWLFALGHSKLDSAILACAEVDEAQQEEDGEDVEEPVLPAVVAGGEMEHGPGNDAEAEAIGDGVSERDEDERKKCGYGDQRLVPADLGDGGEHHGADENERGRSCRRRNDPDEGRGGNGDEKEQAGNDGGDAGAASGCDACGGFDVAGYGGCAGQGSEDGRCRVGEEDAIEARNGVIGGDEAGALGDGDECAEIVEEIDEEEDEDDFEQALC